jgi:HK97 family phage major capsid protein
MDIKEMIEARDALVAELDALEAPWLVEDVEARSVPSDEDVTKAEELRGRITESDEAILRVDADMRRRAAVDEARTRLLVPVGDGVVRSEARTYSPVNPQNSFFADKCWEALPSDPHYRDALARLEQHGKEVVRDSIHDSEERARVARSLKEGYRKDESRARMAASDLESRSMELRAGMDTTAGSGGSFVTPQYFVSDYAPYRQYERVFADLTNKQDLPDYGMTIFLPHVTGPAAVATQATQNQGVSETDPTAGYLSASLVTEAGQVTISQQLLDRAGPGIQFDKIVFDQLQRNYAQQIDAAVLVAALASAGAVTNSNTGASGTNVVQSLMSDVGKAIQAIETTQGTVLAPTHVFTTPTEWAFLETQLDSTGRPIVAAGYQGLYNAAAAASGKENVATSGDTNFQLLSLPVFKDANIPVSGANTQVIVADMAEVWFWEGPLVPRTIPQTFAQNLSVLLQLYSYNAVIVRYPSAVQAVTGARYPATPSWLQS